MRIGLTHKDLNDVKADIEKRISEMRITEVVGGNLTETTNGVILDIGNDALLARVVSSTRIGTTANKWKYAVRMVRLQADLTTVDVSSANVDAYNLMEVNNPASGSGLHGNGVDNSAVDWPANMEIMPAPAGLIVELRKIAGLLMFDHSNAVDGSC